MAKPIIIKKMAKTFVGQEYMTATSGKGLHQQSKGHRVLARTTITCSTIITLVSVFIVVFCIIFQICPVIGTSMMRTLNATGDDTDSALTCIVGEPSRGDIVVMKLYIQNSHFTDYLAAAKGDQAALARLRKLNWNKNYSQADAAAAVKKLKAEYNESDSRGNYKYIVKRLIGKGGDRISMRRIGESYYIYLNGEKLNEEVYLDDIVGEHSAPNFIQLWDILTDPDNADNEDWVTTDYHQLLTENTDTAPDGDGIPSTYMLTVPDDYYFLMGDNRGGLPQYAKSWDSSYFGPLPTSSYYSFCVDIFDADVSMSKYIWNKFVYYVCFGWAWQK